MEWLKHSVQDTSEFQSILSSNDLFVIFPSFFSLVVDRHETSQGQDESLLWNIGIKMTHVGESEGLLVGGCICWVISVGANMERSTVCKGFKSCWKEDGNQRWSDGERAKWEVRLENRDQNFFFLWHCNFTGSTVVSRHDQIKFSQGKWPGTQTMSFFASRFMCCGGDRKILVGDKTRSFASQGNRINELLAYFWFSVERWKILEMLTWPPMFLKV